MMSEPPKQSVRRYDRVEDSRLLMGRGYYINDVQLPGALAVAFVPSLHAHARLLRVDASRARNCPGVHAVLTADDLGDAIGPIRVEYDSTSAPNHRSCDWPVLARTRFASWESLSRW